MNDERANTSGQHEGAIDWSRRSDAERLRALADGELPADAEAELRRAPEPARLERAVSFERRLRERVGATMEGERAPAGLSDRVRAALADAAHEESGGGGGLETAIPRRDRRFWAGGAAWWASIAAAVLVAISVFSLAPRGGGDSGRVLARASEHVSMEHLGCVEDSSYFTAKLDAPAEGAAAQAAAAQHIGGLPVKLRLSGAGYVLAGVGPCHVPGGGASVHLLYEPKDPSTGGPVSLFLQEATEAHAGLREGVVYMSAREGPPMVRIWRVGDVVYHAVTRCPKACDLVEEAYALTGERIPV